MAELATLTTRQQEIYDFICERIDNRGFPPTIRDIGTAFAIKSPNGAWDGTIPPRARCRKTEKTRRS